MQLLLSLSNQLVKLVGADVPRIVDADGNNPGIQPLVTNSAQQSWQLHVVQLWDQRWGRFSNGDWVVMAVESYSRYTVMNVYSTRPDLQQIEDDFQNLLLQHVLINMAIVEVFKNEAQFDSVVKRFKQLNQPEYIRNLDLSINGHISDNFNWLEAYLRDENPKEFGRDELDELCDHLNRLPHHTKSMKKQRDKFYPFERFIADSLFRFASGLNVVWKPGVKYGDFPNPHG